MRIYEMGSNIHGCDAVQEALRSVGRCYLSRPYASVAALAGFQDVRGGPKDRHFFRGAVPPVCESGRTDRQAIRVLGMTYLIIGGCFLMIYGGSAGWIESRFRHHVGRHMYQISGALLVVAAILLGMKEIRFN